MEMAGCVLVPLTCSSSCPRFTRWHKFLPATNLACVYCGLVCISESVCRCNVEGVCSPFVDPGRLIRGDPAVNTCSLLTYSVCVLQMGRGRERGSGAQLASPKMRHYAADLWALSLSVTYNIHNTQLGCKSIGRERDMHFIRGLHNLLWIFRRYS